jgi:hypothetical protein
VAGSGKFLRGSNMNLYDLALGLQEVNNAIMAADGELAPDIEKLLDTCELGFTDKLENIAKLIKNLDSESIAFDVEIKRLSTRKKSADNTVKRLKEYVKESMETAGKSKVECGVFKWAIQKSNASVFIEDEDDIPKEFMVDQDPKVDRKGLMAALKAGREIPGCEIVSDNTHIRLR